jgi:D-galactarolactone cycloisomerase
MTGARVSDVEVIGLRAPLDEPFGYAQEWVTDRTATLVRVAATDGTVGWGECWGPIAGNREIVEDLLADVVLDADPLATERLHERLYGAGRAAFQSFVPLSAISGLDLALWDLKGQLLDRPVATLLGGRRRDAVRAYATGHYFRHGEDLDAQYELIAAEAARNADRLGAVKLKVGLDLLGYGPEEDVELVRRVRSAVDEDTTLFVDANYAYDTAAARRVGRALEALDVAWFEEPVEPENVGGYAHLRDALDVPIAGGECHAPHEIERLLQEGGLDVAQPDVCNVGGLTAARRVASTAASHGVGVVPHVWGTPVALAASLQLIATLPGDPWLEFDRSPNPLREDLAPGDFTPADGRVSVPDGPGLGVTVDADAVERYAVGSASGAND